MQLFEDLYLSTGRLTHLELLLGWHPSFLQAFTITTHFIMRDDGPLPLPWRNYLAILASSRYRCTYLAALHEAEFLANGGDRSWLLGVQHAPRKLQAILELNALLAHQPWLLTRHHIESLVKGKGGDAWSIAELVHACVILTTFHSLAGFAAGLGLNMELDMVDLYSHGSSSPVAPDHASGPPPADRDAANCKSGCTGVLPAHERGPCVGAEGEQLMTLLENEMESERQAGASAAARAEDREHDPFLLADTDGLAELKLDSDSDAVHGYEPDVKDAISARTGPRPLVLGQPATHHRYLSPEPRTNDMTFVPFDVHSKAPKLFSCHEYSWKEHGAAALNRFYQGVVPLLDRELDVIYTLTYNNISDKQGIDTGPFRRAIWYYTQRLYGMCHDDYNYSKIPVFLGPAIKTYVRKVACTPESVTHADFELKGFSFRYDEKCHIALLASEAHRQASLLYGLYAINKYMQ